MKLTAENLKKYVTKEGYEWSWKDIWELFYSSDKKRITDNYNSLNLRERLEFQLDELTRWLIALSSDRTNYADVLDILYNSVAMFSLTIENSDFEKIDKDILYQYVWEKVFNIIKAFYPSLNVVIGGYSELDLARYEDIDIFFLRIVWQFLLFTEPMIEKRDDSVDSYVLLWRLSGRYRQALALFCEKFHYEKPKLYMPNSALSN